MSFNYIMVKLDSGSEPLEIPLDPDNTVSLWKLKAVMGREVVNLKYIVNIKLTFIPDVPEHSSSDIKWKTLQIFNNRVQPPEDGWDSHLMYFCDTTPTQSSGIQLEEANQGECTSHELVELSAKELCNDYESNGFCTKQFDDQCHLIHGDECDVCHRFSLHPFNEVQRENHSKECIEKTLDENDSKICAICWVNLKELFPTASILTPFGLLDCCEHVYCIGCIEKWKEEGHQTCPECRQIFDKIIPCDHFNVVQDEKWIMIREVT